MRRRIWAFGVVVLLVSTSACSSSGRRADPVTTTTTTSAPAGPNPDVIPAVITPAYVDAVFKVLNHIYGDAVRSLVANDTVTELVRTDLRAIFSDPLYAKEIELDQSSLQGGFSNVRKPPGDVTTKVVRLIYASNHCIFVQTTENYDAVLLKPGPAPASGYWGLRLKISSDDVAQLNPTPWSLFFNAVYKTDTSVPDQCVAS